MVAYCELQRFGTSAVQMRSWKLGSWRVCSVFFHKSCIYAVQMGILRLESREECIPFFVISVILQYR